MKIILTGGSGFVGEGVMLALLADNRVEQVLSISRRACGHTHPKLKELLVKDLMTLSQGDERLKGYDALIYCAGISANGLNEQQYRPVTYDIPLHLAQILPNQGRTTLIYLSGAGADLNSKMMWARVKAQAEQAILSLPFQHIYLLRPALMKPTKGQLHVKKLDRMYLTVYPLMRWLNLGNPLSEIGRALINVIEQKYTKQILEPKDLRILGNR